MPRCMCDTADATLDEDGAHADPMWKDNVVARKWEAEPLGEAVCRRGHS